MDRRDLAAIFVLALLARVAVAAFQSHPGYMDAYYYTVGAQRLVEGLGFTEPYVWNYLDDPTSLPRPSHLYWMPLPSILAAASMTIFGSSYHAAQVPFVLLASLVPLIAYTIAWRATSQRRAAWIAALLAIFSGFYVPFWGVPESFAPYAVFGSLALLLAGAGRSKRASFAAGVCAGLAHLTRADGALLLIPVLLSNAELRMQNAELRMKNVELRRQNVELRRQNVELRRQNVEKRSGFLHSSFFILHSLLAVLAGYLVITLPWFVRNVAVVGAPISPAGTRALWLCNYDELFSFGISLDASHWLSCGVDRIVATKLGAAWSGLVHLIAENGLIFLAPLMAVGLWRLRRERLFRPAIGYLVLLYLAMTLVFTFVGERGGLFHSSAALTPFLCAAAPIGLETIVGVVARRRRTWTAATANRVFSVSLVALAAIFSAAIAWGRVIGSDWSRADAAYREVGAWLVGQGDTDSIVMAGNPPGFTYHTGHPSIMIPNGDVDTLLLAAQRFGAQWLVLDSNRPVPLAVLYADPQSDARLKLRATLAGTLLFEIHQQQTLPQVMTPVESAVRPHK